MVINMQNVWEPPVILTPYGHAGICGRGVLVDMVKFYTAKGKNKLPYDPFASHPVPLSDIEAAAEQQGVTFRQGDILLLRMGFTQVRSVIYKML